MKTTFTLFNSINLICFLSTSGAVILVFYMLNETEPGVKEFVNAPVVYAILSILTVIAVGAAVLLKEVIERERNEMLKDFRKWER